MQLLLKHKIVILLISGFSAIFLGVQLLSFSLFESNVKSHENEHIQDNNARRGAQIDEEMTDVSPDKFERLSDNTWHVFDHDRVDGSIENTTKYAVDNDIPIMLWWTPFTADNRRIKKCKTGKCFFTYERQFQDHPLTQAFFFYGTDFKIDDLPLPRKEHHEWALIHEESPKNKAILSQEDCLVLFNHTSTFRQESDYPITTQYLKSMERLLEKPRHTFEEKSKFDIAPVVYLQSGCNPPSDRDAYINELMKYIKIDSYGKCLHNKDLPETLRDPLTMFTKELYDFIGRYKFAIAFENGLCKDYITEKLWRTLQIGVVPIYKGAENIHEWLPDNSSAIYAQDFKHPSELAHFIKNIASNKELYNKYLNYKFHGASNDKLVQHMKAREWGVNDFSKINSITGFECLVCDRIHQNRELIASKKAPLRHVANKNHYGCPRPIKLTQFDDPPGIEDWERNTWTWEFDSSINEAAKIRKEVLGY